MTSLLLSATHKSSGKTVLCTALAAILKARGLNPRPYKKGPDYIDPQWLSAAAGCACYNLDFNVQSSDEIIALVAAKSPPASFTLIEANKGLYDGVSLDGSDSNAALAKLLKCPVLLVVDCEGMTRGIAPLLLGYSHFDAALSIGGVILNRVGGARHQSKLLAAVEQYTDIPVMGAVMKDKALLLPERHLGLIPARESSHTSQWIETLAAQVAAQLDIERIIKLAKQAMPLPSGDAKLAAQAMPLPSEDAKLAAQAMPLPSEDAKLATQAMPLPSGDAKLAAQAMPLPSRDAKLAAQAMPLPSEDAKLAAQAMPLPSRDAAPCKPSADLRIGVFYDAAFGFYYPDDLEALEHFGAELLFINSLSDVRLPPLDGLLIGGGFPETQADALEANRPLRRAVAEAIEGGLPAYAECGGLMYLTRGIHWQGRYFEMCGVLDAAARMNEAPQGRGYVELVASDETLWGAPNAYETGAIIYAHEFHYSRLIDVKRNYPTAYRVVRGEGLGNGRDGIIYKNLLATYAHQRNVCGCWADRFSHFVRRCKDDRSM